MNGSEVVSASTRSVRRHPAVEAVRLRAVIRLSTCELLAISFTGRMSRGKDTISFSTHKPEASPEA
jgi:hypothetical protein